jgi:zinc protease
LDEISRQADSPFLAAYYNRSNLVRPIDSIDIGAQVRDEEILEGLDGVVTEVERIRRHGFTESELERAKTAVLTFYRRMYNNRENWESEAYAAEYLRNFFTNEPIPGIARELQIAETLLPGISLTEVNDLVEDLVGEENRTVVVIAPEKEEIVLPGESELGDVLASVEEKDLDPYVDIDVAGELVTEIPTAVDVLTSREIEELGITEIELTNGVRVIMKPTNFTQQVVFVGLSPGGSSLVADEEIWEAAFIANVVAESGLGDYERTEINRLLTGRSVGVSPGIEDLTESIGGAAPPDELEPLFQLIYLYFTEPRADEAAFATFQDQVRAFLRNRGLTPSAALEDALGDILYGDSPRHGIPTVEQIDALDLERAFEIYQERFADASDFTFIFVGDFNVDVITDYAQTYLGNLPTLAREESWQDVQPDRPDGVVEEAVYAGQEQQSIVQLLFTGPFEPDYATELRLRALETVLDILIREDLRERRGGVYASFVSAQQETEPDPLYNVQVAFSTDPERVDELITAVFDLIDQVQSEGPSADLMTKATAQMLRERELALEDNSFWLEQLGSYALDPEADLRKILSFDEDVLALTAEEIQALAQEILRDDQYIQVVLYPQAMQP